MAFGSRFLGQASTEYLILLAITLALALVVLGVVDFFPSFSYSAQSGDSVQYWSNAASPIAIIDFMQNASNFSAIVENRAGTNLHLTAFTLSIGSASYSPSTSLPTLAPGGRAPINWTTVSCSGRQALSYTVQINYSTDQIGGLSEAGAKPLYVQCSN